MTSTSAAKAGVQNVISMVGSTAAMQGAGHPGKNLSRRADMHGILGS
jgi:hypothetical protein